MKELYTTEEAAVFLGVSASRIRQLISEGRIKSIKIGRDHIIVGTDLLVFSKNGKKKRGRPSKK